MASRGWNARFNRDAKFRRPAPPVIPAGRLLRDLHHAYGCEHVRRRPYSTLGRLLNLEVVNLGFSGCGTCDPEMADLMGELDAALFCVLFKGQRRWRNAENCRNFTGACARNAHRPDSIVSGPAIHPGLCARRPEPGGLPGYHDPFLFRHAQAGDRNVHFVDGEALIPFGASCAHVMVAIRPIMVSDDGGTAGAVRRQNFLADCLSADGSYRIRRRRSEKLAFSMAD